MLDSIFVGMSGLNGFAEGLRVISNNAANLNTPGFKGSTLQFADLFYANDPGRVPGSSQGQLGYGLDSFGTSLNFTQGELRQTGNSLDLAVDGQGMFTLRDANGALHYTRAGQFEFGTDGVLVNSTDHAVVVSTDAAGHDGVFDVDGHRTNPAVATRTVAFAGNVSTDQNPVTIDSVRVVDASGSPHTLKMTLTKDSVVPGQWTVELLDGTTSAGTGTIAFIGSTIDPAQSTVSITYHPANEPAMPLTLDFGTDVSSTSSGEQQSTLAVSSQDGRAEGTLSGTTFDSDGTLVFSYSNGQTVKGDRLRLGRFDTTTALTAVGDNQFDAKGSAAFHVGLAGGDGFGQVRAGVLEASNVNLAQEFSELVIMQRGYQASSQVISTANDMLQQLFTMTGQK